MNDELLIKALRRSAATMIAHYADLTDPGLDDDPISVQVEVLVRCLQRQLEPRLYALAFDAVAAAHMGAS